jgi:hypothetical protein
MTLEADDPCGDTLCQPLDRGLSCRYWLPGAFCAQAQAGRPTSTDARRGRWFIVHKDAEGRWTPDKIAVAVVIDDRVADFGSQLMSGQWLGPGRRRTASESKARL